jgi:tRNA pseudouridine32 synthase/23S rRNA pseudouridine746 synthase
MPAQVAPPRSRIIFPSGGVATVALGWPTGSMPIPPAAHTVQKTYWAVVQGVPSASSGTINAALRKQSDQAGWRIITNPTGQPAITEWRILATSNGRALLELLPRTGRTHQLRVHCATIGHAIVGDKQYGKSANGLCLLARQLDLPLDPAISATAAIPAHLRAALSGVDFDCLEPG